MSTFNYHIDTKSLAQEMENVSKSVNLTTGAVVAMQEAVVAAEEKATDHVCDNVNRGFYSLIRSQISQKLAKHKSDFESKRMLLSHQKRALVNVRNSMERDYKMISGRYAKLFNNLNINLQTRIFELDKPMIDFSYRDIGKISNRTKYLTATIPVTQLESVSSSQKIVASNIKQKGLQVINSIKNFIQEMSAQESLTRNILVDESIKSDSDAYLPVIICEYSGDSSGYKTTEIISALDSLDESAKSALNEALLPQFENIANQTGFLEWQELHNEFEKQLWASKKPPRVKEVAMELFKADKLKTVNH
jgi:hypothetical protein